MQLIITYIRQKDILNENKMMRQYKYLIFTLFSLILFGACDKDECSDAQLNLSFITNINQDQLVLNDVLYDDYMGRKFRIELLKFYFSELCFRKTRWNISTCC